MKIEYEQSPIEERKMWKEKLRNQFMNKQFENNIIEKSVKFIRSEYTSTLTPKSILNAYCIQAHTDKPVYHTVNLFEIILFLK
jgi:hypothetical protein